MLNFLRNFLIEFCSCGSVYRMPPYLWAFLFCLGWNGISAFFFGLYFPGMLIYFYLIHWSFIFLNLKSVCSIYLPIYWLNWFCFGVFFFISIYPGIDPLQDKYLVLKIVLFVVLLCTFWFVYISWNWSSVRWVSSKEFFFIMWTVSLLSVDDFLCWVGLFYYFSVSVLFYFNFFLDLLSLS